ncbi:MAG TPA: metallophosphoesterase family protein [Candidatus Acidoferrales bacterium]|nr:metallophosphoesterase family protein [Candidatus Acidoferrales bacterium]
MTTLIIADIHANAAALAALPPAHKIICAGDVVTFGAEPNICIDWLRQRDALCIRGEEDDAVAHERAHALPQRLAAAGIASRSYMRSQLTPDNLAWLANLPPEIHVAIEGCRVGVVHAYPGDYNRYLLPTDEELERITRAFPLADVIVTAHTHRQGIWHCRGKVVINPGSVGQNASPGLAAYALLDRGRISFGTARYDVDFAVDSIRRTGLPPEIQDACIRELTEGSMRPSSRLPWPVHSVPA